MLISELITKGDIEVVTVGEYKDVHRIEFYAFSNKVLGILL